MRRFGLAALQLELGPGNNMDVIAAEIASASRRFPWIDMVMLAELASHGVSLDAAEPLPGPTEQRYQEIARKHGAIATFMPKPFSNRTGTGAHFHISMGDAKRKNLFHDDKDKRGLGMSALGYQFLGGLLAHARALAGVCAPTINSYKRLVVGRSLSGATWAPAYIAYGDNNRTACVRIPYGRIEMRLPDGACNPYLAAAAILAAGLDGIERKLDPGEPVNENLYELTPKEIRRRKIGLLPQNLSEAMDALEADEIVKAGLGVDLAKEFIELKRMEWVEYSRHVSDWETARYVEMF